MGSHVSQAGLKIHCVAKDDPELNPPASTSSVLDLLVRITTLIDEVTGIESRTSCVLGKHYQQPHQLSHVLSLGISFVGRKEKEPPLS